MISQNNVSNCARLLSPFFPVQKLHIFLSPYHEQRIKFAFHETPYWFYPEVDLNQVGPPLDQFLRKLLPYLKKSVSLRFFLFLKKQLWIEVEMKTWKWLRIDSESFLSRIDSESIPIGVRIKRGLSQDQVRMKWGYSQDWVRIESGLSEDRVRIKWGSSQGQLRIESGSS